MRHTRIGRALGRAEGMGGMRIAKPPLAARTASSTQARCPPSAMKTLYSKVSGSAVYDSVNGYYSFPCKSAPSVSGREEVDQRVSALCFLSTKDMR